MCKCSVIIPTKNAIPYIHDVLSAVRGQKTEWAFEIIVIDSGSTDGTLPYLDIQSDIHVIKIDPGSFGHGRTRNQAIASANGELIALLTQDACPENEHWLALMVEAVEQDPRIAGVFGRHVARDDASPFTKRDLYRHFESFLAQPLVVSRETDRRRYETDERWRQFLHFYSDNNSLMRKSVWEKHPYPDVEFAEDQIWARNIIDHGFSKAYAPTAVVIHSHDYTPAEQLRRAFDEARNFKKYFDYNLAGSLYRTIRSAAHMAARAIVDTPDPEQFGRVTMRDRLVRAMCQASLVLGHYLGANHSRLPDYLIARLSLDNRLFRKGV